MASTKSYLEYVLDLLSDLEGISYRAMMGDYSLFCQGRVFAGIYDDRFLIKPLKYAVGMLPDAEHELPYDGAKEMLLVDTEDREFLKELIKAMYAELPAPKKRK